ncbi:MAG: hypothetical protein ACI9HY_003015 [Planctomycetaceae bacterium]
MFGWYTSERYRQVNYIVAIEGTIFFLLAYANTAERKVRAGEGDVVTVHTTDGSPPRQAIMLATTVKFVFLYDHAAQRVDINPNESILMLSVTSPATLKMSQPSEGAAAP